MALTSSSAEGLRRRRNVQDLSRRDVARLRSAFQAMMDSEGEDGYQRWAGIHGFPDMRGRHGDPTFLPWNRIYLARFEEALQRYDARVSLPWWDWTADPRIPPAFADPEADGRPNPLYASRIDSRERGDETGDIPAETFREPGP
ncbi:MAG: tyrosinase family protein, partial [Solirubrobacterales bacterium]